MAPFIELGVGFNPERAARENVVLNGVLMGLGRREAQRRVDAVLDFAELRDFADLKLKNYSSGMMVRLAFAIMVQADADVMLIDEVLAVGDAAFAAKCMDVFHERRRRGRTVVLVTHDMTAVRTLCHRAMLLHDGRTQFIGGAEDAALRYYRLNFTKRLDDVVEVPDYQVAVTHAHLRNRGERLATGAPIAFDVGFRAQRDFPATEVELQLRSTEHVTLHTVTRRIEEPLRAGDTFALTGTIENRLLPGRYALDCWVRRPVGGEVGVQGLRLLEFEVDGPHDAAGLIALRTDVELIRG
jgi:ABC-2 type transport system ATP-binding protein